MIGIIAGALEGYFLVPKPCSNSFLFISVIFISLVIPKTYARKQFKSVWKLRGKRFLNGVAGRLQYTLRTCQEISSTKTWKMGRPNLIRRLLVSYNWASSLFGPLPILDKKRENAERVKGTAIRVPCSSLCALLRTLEIVLSLCNRSRACCLAFV